MRECVRLSHLASSSFTDFIFVIYPGDVATTPRLWLYARDMCSRNWFKLATRVNARSIASLSSILVYSFSAVWAQPAQTHRYSNFLTHKSTPAGTKSKRRCERRRIEEKWGKAAWARPYRSIIPPKFASSSSTSFPSDALPTIARSAPTTDFSRSRTKNLPSSILPSHFSIWLSFWASRFLFPDLRRSTKCLL